MRSNYQAKYEIKKGNAMKSMPVSLDNTNIPGGIPENNELKNKSQAGTSITEGVDTRYNPHNSTGITLKIYEHELRIEHSHSSHGSKKPPKRKRKDIQRFSRKSRMRMFHKLNRLETRQLSSALFTSVTFHEDYEMCQEWLKEKRDRFLRILREQLEDLVYVWRIELQERGAPHFHFIFWTKNPERNFGSKYYKRMIRDAWYDVNPCNCRHCRRHSVKTVTVDSYRKTSSYLSKYIAKEDEVDSPVLTGRRWGWSSNAPTDPIIEREITPWEYERLHKIVKRVLRDSLGAEKADCYDYEKFKTIFIWGELRQFWETLREASLNNVSNELVNVLKYSDWKPPDDILSEIADDHGHNF